ncbi:MAG: NAD(P)/FAD-dependent oxidoreductase [Pseudomonas sp.]|nr:NAD(P)/FAD-dependent oxidoreductase [Pseudomonas sp.]
MPPACEYHDVIILGAGASGLLCGFTAARRGRSVLILERANKVGKKILMSGGGRCNFTNHFVEADNFLSDNPHFCKSALKGYTQWDFIALVEKHGIAYEERKHSQLFCKDSAKDIVAMLLDECAEAGAQVRSDCELDGISALDGDNRRYQLELHHDGRPQTLQCQSLVVATGALSVPTLGGSGVGYEIARQFGLSVTERRAGLVPFMFSDNIKNLCERLSGTALEVSVSCNGTTFNEAMLFTHRGLSGPAMLQISNYWYPGNTISIDLLPGQDAAQWLRQHKQEQGRSRLRTLLSQPLPKALVSELQTLWWPGKEEAPLAEFSDRDLQRIGQLLNAWQLKPSATEGYRTAEVTLGGIDCNELSSRTMESSKVAGLYFIGEVVDVTGWLGGYNFQWAWSSGWCAGQVV